MPHADPVYIGVTLFSQEIICYDVLQTLPLKGGSNYMGDREKTFVRQLLGYRKWVRTDTSLLQKHCVSVHITFKSGLVQQNL